ncbi:hypothetical protein BZA05DRAFT_342548 [Tricharina praecox]|uniref:uncharacterized protein n=1 Tax=Tricharina praecox TaxID=43433 RepID=UPI0022211D13|nr:uncharacterized protein BZA05DRAFT_342548 [Tricharina praecox]KAI5845390.1 hypothetical protein BZA05DRAFT_342548 [Tricharina praecox]
MPCMYPPHPGHPLTPPEYLQQYAGCGMQIQHQYPVGAHGLPVPEKGLYEINVDAYGRKIMPSFVRVPQAGYHHPQQQQQQQSGYAGLPPPGITHPGSQYYAPQQRIEATIPGGKSYAAELHARQEARRLQEQQQAQQAEEKPTGGVSAHLDYDMEEMTDFVGTMAQRLVLGQMTHDKLLPSYRKFVYQILSSTRLPSSTILLGLCYLRERMAQPQMPGMTRQDNNVYRLLTISLLLASKFLDDNTFQNKSWSEVTNIPVQELNALEKEWLKEMRWNLHIDPEGTKGFSQYKNTWEAWVKRKAVAAAPALALAPIDTNIRARSHSTFSPVQPYPVQQQQQQQSMYTPPHSTIMTDRSIHLPPVRPTQPSDGYWGWNPADYSPPSAPETGPTTPENHHFGWAAVPYGNPPQPAPTFSRLPPIANYHPHAWHSHHGHTAAGCFQCRQQTTENFFANANYGQPITA